MDGRRRGRALGWQRPALLLALLPVAAPAGAAPGAPTVAFFYGRPVPVAELSRFDWVVVQPGNLRAGDLAALRRAGVHVHAYLSLGEAEPDAVDPAWIIGADPAWGTAIVDPAAEGWRQRILRRADALSRAGYRGLFLDNLDAWAAVLRGAQAERAAAAMAGLVQAIHDRRPDLRLFLNRGFEILQEVGPLASGLAAESLFFGWDARAGRYLEVAPAEREWLAARLAQVRQRLGIPIVVVDYLPPARRDEAREAARRIAAMGYVPWISTPSLDVLGVGVEPGAGGRE